MKEIEINKSKNIPESTHIHYFTDEIDLRQLFKVLWVEKWLIFLFISIGGSVALISSLLLTELYRAEITLSPADFDQGSSGLINQLGGAATLLGVSVGGNSGDDISTALAILRSRHFIGQFIEKNNLIVPLFATTWDKKTLVSNIDKSKVDPETGEWLTPRGEPTIQDGYKEFQDIINVFGPDRTTGIIRITIDWHNPFEASEWLNGLVESLNAELKLRDVTEANKAIAFLRQQMVATQLVEMQQVFSQLIESQTRIVMLADVRDEYIFRVIDPAVVPEYRYFPNSVYFMTIGFLVGLILSLIMVYIRRVFLVNRF